MDSHRLDHVTGPGWLAAGDAANSSDFLASRGLHQAIDMGIRSASAVLDELAGRPTGRHRFQRASEQRFEELLRLRGKVYACESRFTAETFWRRRRDRVSLDPYQLVAFTESAAQRSRLEGLGMHLPNDQLHLLCSLCVAPRLVHAVVGAFKESYAAPGSSPPSDQRILLALQYLVEQGLVTAE
jgi:flavin-dependent dehydrogenase